MTKSGTLIRTIRLDDASIRKIPERLDGNASSDAAADGKTVRHPFRSTDCVLYMLSRAGDAPMPYLVPTRNLGNTGMSFLHGAFLYPGAGCVMQLRTIHGEVRRIAARIVACEYVSTGIHEVDVRFAEPIEASQYCAQAARSRVLIVDDDEGIVQSTVSILSELSATCESTTDRNAAVDLALGSVFDFILIGIESPAVHDHATLCRLRESGYLGTIVAVIASPVQENEKKRLHPGFTGWLQGPLDREKLGKVIRAFRRDPLISTFSNDDAMQPLIGEFVHELPKRIRQLESTFVNADVGALQKACRDLKSDAGSFGFEPISIISAEVETGLVSQKSIDELKKPMESLVRLCRQAQARPSA